VDSMSSQLVYLLQKGRELTGSMNIADLAGVSRVRDTSYVQALLHTAIATSRGYR
jgi:hypothetical protein